jgi:hypothetical protein
MNAFRCLYILLVAALPAMSSQAQTATREPYIAATLTAEPDALFFKQNFRLILTIRAANVRLDSSFQMANMPDSTTLKTGTFRELPMRQENETGQAVTVRTFQSEACGLTTGALVVKPDLKVVVLNRVITLFGPQWERQERWIDVAPLALDIRPLPPPPPGVVFSEAVGRFTFTATPHPITLAPGDLVTLAYTVSGTGNLDSLLPPRLAGAPRFKIYDVKPVTTEPQAGRKFEQVLIPQNEQATEIPAIAFTSFDPDAGRYITSTQGPFRITFQARTTDRFEPFRPAAATATKPAANGFALPAQAWWKTHGWEALYATGVLILLAGAFMLRRLRVPLIIIVLIAAPAGFLPLRRHMDTRRGAAWEVTHPQTARLAPAETALELFTVPATSRVTVVETSGDWRKVIYQGQRGWLQAK